MGGVRGGWMVCRGEGMCMTHCSTPVLYFLTSLTYKSLAAGVSLVYLKSVVEQASM